LAWFKRPNGETYVIAHFNSSVSIVLFNNLV
jgi:hypothetical protein